MSKHFQFKKHDKDFTISSTDILGRKVTKFIHFREVDSSFGFLQLIRAEKDGIDVPFALFDIQKNHIIHKWSQLDRILAVVDKHAASTSDRVRVAVKILEEIEELQDSTSCQFIIDQLQLLLTHPNGRRYTKHTLVFAVELWCISPAPYRMLRNSKTVT